MKSYQMQFQHYLKSLFYGLQKKNPRYSLRAFALKLGISSGSLSQVLSGKRSLSKNKIESILNLLEASQEVHEKVFYSPQDEDFSVFFNKYEDFSKYVILNNEQTHSLLEDDLVVQLLALGDTDDFQNDPQWMAEKLDVDIDRVQALLTKDLESWKTQKEHLQKKLKTFFQTTDSKTSPDLRRYHTASLQEAITKIESLPTEQRDFTSCVFACDPEKYEQAQNLIRHFHHQLMALMSTGPKTEVFKLNVQLYPCTQKPKESSSKLLETHEQSEPQ